MEKVLVTGASGFIGAHCIIKLLDKGYHVRGTVRNMERVTQLKEMFAQHTDKVENLSFVPLDLMSDTGWKAAASGCTYIMHVASPVPTTLPKDENEIILPAREGTLRALRAGTDAGVKRVVLTSSIAAVCYGHSDHSKTFTEADWSVIDSGDVMAYPKSKTIAEQAAWQLMEETGTDMELVTINPCLVFGPALEKDIGSSLEVVKKMLKGEMPGAPKIGWPIVDVRDVAEMHLLAMTNPEAKGQRFICANDTMWMMDIAKVLQQHFPQYRRKLPKRTLPNWLIKATALFDAQIRSVLTELDKPQHVSSQKARDVLGWTPRSNEEAIVSAAKSMIEYKVV